MNKYFAEFLGTGFYVFLGSFTAIMISQNNIAANTGLPMAPAIVFGSVYIGIYFAFIAISGAHFNPAISAAAFINRHIDFKELVFYILSQLVGAFIAVAFLSVIFSDAQNNNLALTAYSIHYTHSSAFTYEFLATFVLCFLYLSIVEKEETVVIGGIFIGVLLTALIFLGTDISGGSMNPARSIPAALFTQDPSAMRSLSIYITAPMLAGISAGYLKKLFE